MEDWRLVFGPFACGQQTFMLIRTFEQLNLELLNIICVYLGERIAFSNIPKNMTLTLNMSATNRL